MVRCKASDIHRSEAYFNSTLQRLGMRITQPFGYAQDHEFIESRILVTSRGYHKQTKGRELVERQMGVFRQPLRS